MPHANKSTELSLMAMVTLSTFCLLIALNGCKTRVLVLNDNQAVTRVQENKPFTPKINGYFVPDARMQQILIHLQNQTEAQK